ncbi:transcriptional regulator [Tistlia consotensis]|uniref:Transcriptional regulator n=1 Tax=Tistlia consotensis USBA 355 TaxID=560819 RepID=A0A1Y6CGA8_9PROT|nr:LysR substrate-binding domain-containing protein [Tistlia consotensis]SMF51702.1 transcriptional regulator [Tistlia consotensis USBA 355]SNR83848.1 transcriptional regulator [Tistlia consotensis]
MAFSFRQLQYFIAVAESGTISGAAQQLSVSQSTITEALQDLEAELGARLLERHPRGMALSHRGHQFLRHARRILAEVQSARTLFSGGAEAIRGTLNLGVTSIVAGYVISDLLARYRRAYPEIAVSAIEDTSEYLEHLLLNGELDLIVAVLAGLGEPSAFDSTVIERSGFRVWLPGGHAFGRLAAVGRDRIAGESHIQLAADEVRAAHDSLWRGRPGRPKIVFRTRSVEAVRSLVATGAGIAVLPDLIYRPWSLDGDRIEAVALEEPLPTLEVGLAWRRGSSLSASTQAFIELAGEKSAAA